jgi:hypothetical protein
MYCTVFKKFKCNAEELLAKGGQMERWVAKIERWVAMIQRCVAKLDRWLAVWRDRLR